MSTTTITATAACGWCGDSTPDHRHFAVLVRDFDGTLLGRLCPDWTTSRRNVFAAVLSRARADWAAAEINAEGELTARVVPF